SPAKQAPTPLLYRRWLRDATKLIMSLTPRCSTIRFADTDPSHYAASLLAYPGDSSGRVPTGSITAPSNSKVLAIFAGSGLESTVNPPPYDECGTSCF